MFCNVPSDLKERLAAYIQVEADSNLPVANQEKALSLVERLRGEAKTFCSREEAISVLTSLKEMAKINHLSPELRELYQVSVSYEDGLPPRPSSIGQWLDQNKEEKGYFAKAESEMQSYTTQVPRDIMAAVGSVSRMLTLGAIDDEARYKTVTQQRRVVTGFSFTTDMPFWYMKIRLEPTLPNLTPEECLIAPILSRTHIRLFWAFSHFEYIDWDKTRRVGRMEWLTLEVPLKDEGKIEESIGAVLAKFSSFVEDPLKAKWGPSAPANPSS